MGNRAFKVFKMFTVFKSFADCECMFVAGLNLMSQFNIENVTLFNSKAEDYEKNRKMVK